MRKYCTSIPRNIIQKEKTNTVNINFLGENLGPPGFEPAQ